MIFEEGLQRLVILLQTIGPVIVAHFLDGFFHHGTEPRHHGLQGGGFFQIFIGAALGFVEGLEQSLRNPAVLFINVATDRDRVHDREDFGLAIIFALDLRIIGEETQNFEAIQRRGRAGCMEGIQLAIAQHLRNGFVLRDRFHFDVGGQIKTLLFGATRLFFATRIIGHAVDRHAVVLGQNTANPDRCRHLVFRHADLFADEILRRLDAGFGAHIDAGMTEEA